MLNHLRCPACGSPHHDMVRLCPNPNCPHQPIASTEVSQNLRAALVSFIIGGLGCALVAFILMGYVYGLAANSKASLETLALLEKYWKIVPLVAGLIGHFSLFLYLGSSQSEN